MSESLKSFTKILFNLQFYEHSLGEERVSGKPKLRRASSLLIERVFFNLVRDLSVSVIWEAGCFNGRHSRRFLAESEATVYAFEPNKYCFSLLSDLMHNPRFFLHPFALSDSNGLSPLFLPTKINNLKVDLASGISGLAKRNNPLSVDTHFCATVRGDLFPLIIPPVIESLWLDTEGHACEVLEGFGSTIERFKIIFVEIEYVDIFDTGANSDAIFDRMSSAGFIPVLRDFVNLGQCNVLFIKPELASAFDDQLQSSSELFIAIKESLQNQ